ncbi:MAG: hypothetical protein AAF806_05230 [Bacteroidota bacterium]
MIITSIHASTQAQDRMDYTIPIEVEGSLKKVSRVLFDTKSYPNWNSVFELNENEDFKIGKKFRVKFKDSDGKTRAFNAKLIRKTEHSFVAQQKVFFGWILKATHHFVLKEIDSESVQFTQHFELGGLLGHLMRKKIIESLVVFEQVNEELKNHIEKNLSHDLYNRLIVLTFSHFPPPR